MVRDTAILVLCKCKELLRAEATTLFAVPGSAHK
jgi:hypothetical protein